MTVATEHHQTSSVEGLVKRAKVNELTRDFSRFTSGPLTRIVEMTYGRHARVFISKHFPERLVDRNFSKREDRLYLFKLLSFVFEKHGEKLFADQDVFVRHHDYIVMIYSEFRNGVQQIRLNTFLPFGDNAWIKSKEGRQTCEIEVQTADLLGYVPCTLRN